MQDAAAASLAAALLRCQTQRPAEVRVSKGADCHRHQMRVQGIRRSSSAVAYVTFSLMLVPFLRLLAAHTGTKAIMRRVLEGGLQDPEMLQAELIDELAASGSLRHHSSLLIPRRWMHCSAW